ncbi:hypothetical protein HK100_012233 [Physocladia obscura]|uniref:Methyltransferase domain-containing protein n=1 Tax=Physocladia obscura TaxID=109957 RepID=A0AAD5XGD9_9FUNG|nr:hypothetical protein HK100_012233 [Physocladia obscura]
MGPRQSKLLKNQLSKPIEAANHAEFTNLDFANSRDDFQPASPKSMSSAPPLNATGSIKTLPAPHIDKLQAKVWNPNSADSWDADMRGYHSVEESDYALPSDEIEQNRLETQHYLLRAMFNGDIVCSEVKELVKKAGTKVLDVGCAKGFWLDSVRKEYPLSEYYGVDIAESLATEASPEHNVTIKFGNVLEGLPCDNFQHEDNTFDYTHQRLLVFGMPKEKYPEALKELIRVTKAGGWIELIEVDIMAYKAGPYSKQLSQAMLGAMQARGLDCYAATNLEWHARDVRAHISNQQIKTVHLPFNDNTNLGRLSGPNSKNVFLALEDWMHKAMGVSREEFRELVENCFVEWAEYKTFWQVRALYFQVKK